ncbi:hypothetical protein K435DRAFT_819762 [Dendrothele bispora CBS 962.96]|uniref:General stress protein FMN-binding split barrel domain-containing protein n=1 Tax=Dendrothele bispora (strain CBS 962.96) TaxID=1314807 RepID=A0A4S8M1B1_DENBC|nr:hypothetical protein K435DRAFT_819762 [Dendrothele bispora CBS 962.96]
MSSQPTSLDPYTTKSENTKATPQEKINGFQEIVKTTKTGMLTTRSSSGHLHSRAMIPTSPDSQSQIDLLFFGNNASHKFDEIKHDEHVNVSFCDTNSTSWVSVSGVAKISQDRDLIKKHWHASLSAWFGDLKDGVHKGDENDPRVSLIRVVPDEIRYFKVTRGTVGQAIETGINTFTHGVSTPGELITITSEEIQLAQGLHGRS